MKVSEYAQQDGLGLAGLIRSGEVSVKEVAVAATQAIEALNPALNAVLEVHLDKLDGSGFLPPDPSAPFAGVPMLLKDIGATEAGRRQEMGSPLFAGRIAAENTYLTDRFQAAGLINLGRTAVPEFGMASSNTVSELHGSTVNPWHTDYMAGSSSGGAGAAVASGMVPIAHASDIGGSTRHPAGICGAVGLKASRSRISLGPERSDFPLGTLNEFAITRSVRDCAALLDAIEGPGHGEVRCVERPAQPFLQEVLDIQEGQGLVGTGHQMRVAAFTGSFIALPVDDEIVQVVNDVAQTLETLGAELNADGPAIDYRATVEADTLAAGSFVAMALRHLAHDAGMTLDRGLISPVVNGLIDIVDGASAQDLFEAFEQYNQTRRAVNVFFEDYDLLVLPVMSCQSELAKLHLLEQSVMESDNWQHHYQYLLPFNVSGNPAISLPLGTSSSGMPIGVQLVAKFGDEATLLRAAAALEQAMPWAGRIPPRHASRL